MIARTASPKVTIGINLDPYRCFIVLLLMIGILTIAHSVSGLAAYRYPDSSAMEIYTVLSLGYDQSVPTHFAVTLWFICSWLSWRLSCAPQNTITEKRGWRIIAAISLFNSIDEMVMLHERLTQPFRNLVGAEGYLWFAWVIPYGVALIVLAILLMKFLMGLPRLILGLLVVSGLIFVTGAIGFEMLSAELAFNGEAQSIKYRVLFTIEEILEMLGVSLFLCTLIYALQEEVATTGR